MSLTLAHLLAGLTDPPRYVGCDAQSPVTGLEVDSRRVRDGFAFLALRGETHDGHTFIESAIRDGASIVIARQLPAGVAGVELPDTQAAYPQIAANFHGRPARGLRLCGVTGTNGKTTTAHLVGQVLAHAGRNYARLGTTGNFVVDREEPSTFTTPFPLELQKLLRTARVRGGTDVVMEVSSHALAQGRVRPLAFDAVALTSFSQDHLNFHHSMAAYQTAKCRLASEHLAPDGVAIAAIDDNPAADAFIAGAQSIGATVWRASRRDPDAELRAIDIDRGPHGTDLTLATPRGTAPIVTPLIGGFNVDNLLVTAGLCLGLGVSLDVVAAGLANASGAPGRLERVAVSGVPGPTVFVDYAHTPDAVHRALGVMRSVARARVTIVLGCGGDRDRGKRPKMGAAAAEGADRVFATSDNPRTEDPDQIVDEMLAGIPRSATATVVREVDRATAIAEAIATAAPDDLVLIAGKGHEDYQILGTRKIAFDDREHARIALGEPPATAPPDGS